MFKIIKYNKLNEQSVVYESNDYDQIQKVYDGIKTEKKLYGEELYIYELIEDKGDERIGIAFKSDIVLSLERKKENEM